MPTAKPAVECSIIVPVFNSEQTVGEVIDRTAAACDEAGISYEIIAVNDGSRDGVWEVLEKKAVENPNLIAIDLLKNYGQHTAVFEGLKVAKGMYVVTIDDDLQNPPEEIPPILAKAREGHDLVFGRFRQKRHALYRRLGTKVVDWMNRRVFGKPKDLVLTNFRAIRRDVVDRMVSYQGAYPYIPGLALMYSRKPANLLVEHEPRRVGASGYSMGKILELVFRILFNYSSFPLRFVSTIGLLVTAGAFLLTGFLFLRAVIVGTTVPGWASVAVMLSFFNGVTLLIISMLGEYVVRLLDQSSQATSYHVRTRIGTDV